MKDWYPVFFIINSFPPFFRLTYKATKAFQLLIPPVHHYIQLFLAMISNQSFQCKNSKPGKQVLKLNICPYSIPLLLISIIRLMQSQILSKTRKIHSIKIPRERGKKATQTTKSSLLIKKKRRNKTLRNHPPMTQHNSYLWS